LLADAWEMSFYRPGLILKIPMESGEAMVFGIPVSREIQLSDEKGIPSHQHVQQPILCAVYQKSKYFSCEASPDNV
jgi:hypothetical protein